MTRKIIIADDHALILDGIKSLISTDASLEIVGTSNDGEEVLRLIDETEEVDLLILDINMPRMDGIEVTKALKSRHPEIKVLILSMYNRSEFIKTLIAAGADGYILKDSSRDVLIEAIQTLCRGERYFSKEILENLIDSYVETDKSRDLIRVELSDREKEVVKLIAEEKSTVEIADELFLSVHTINSHRKSILNKLDVKNTAGIFRYAIQTGIIKGFDL